jgi:hypothetical protein
MHPFFNISALLILCTILTSCTKKPQGNYVGVFSTLLYEFQFSKDGTVTQQDMRNRENFFKGTWETYAGEVIASIDSKNGNKTYTSYFKWSEDKRDLILTRFFLTSKVGKNGKHFLKEPAIFRQR